MLRAPKNASFTRYCRTATFSTISITSEKVVKNESLMWKYLFNGDNKISLWEIIFYKITDAKLLPLLSIFYSAHACYSIFVIILYNIIIVVVVKIVFIHFWHFLILMLHLNFPTMGQERLFILFCSSIPSQIYVFFVFLYNEALLGSTIILFSLKTQWKSIQFLFA